MVMSWADGSGQARRGIAAMLAKTATIAAAQGQVEGSRSRRRRLPWVSLAGTCRNRYRSALGSQEARGLASPVRASRRVQATRSAAMAVSSSQAALIAKCREGKRPRPESLACRMRSSTRAWARCRASRNASCPAVVLVTKAW